MAKKYVITKLEEDVHTNLKRLCAIRELQDGTRPTISALIREMIESQPVWQIFAEQVKNVGESGSENGT